MKVVLKEEGQYLNKINTNATTFCLLKNDMNKVLKHYGHQPISFNGKSKSEQIKEVISIYRIYQTLERQDYLDMRQTRLNEYVYRC